MEEAIEQPTRHKFVMPCRPDRRVHIELLDRLCGLFIREGVPCAHVREKKHGPHLSYICHTLLRDMMTPMRHVVDALMLIQSLWDCAQSRSSP